MAVRPVFVPTKKGRRLVDEVPIEFVWHPGMAPSQKRKNVTALHDKAALRGLSPLLEVSSKSEWELGRRLSAFYLKINIDGIETTLECAFQGSKVFEKGGPFSDLYLVDSRTAKRDIRLKDSGKLKGFSLEGREFPLSPATAFYDWLYLNALFAHRSWLLERLNEAAGFTDIEFNPARSLNCQARSCATFFSLNQRNLLDDAVESFDFFRDLLQSGTPC